MTLRVVGGTDTAKQTAADKTFNVKVGQRLQTARIQADLSQDHVGALLNIHGTTVKRHEDGTVPLTCVRAKRFAEIVGLTMVDLFK